MNNAGYPLYGEDDPQTAVNTRDIAALQEEMVAIEGQIKTLQDDEKQIVSRLADIESKQAGMQTNSSTLQAIAADTFSVVLTCPVSAQTATLTVPAGGVRYFYYFGYAPNASPFTLSSYSGGGNFRLGTYGLIWTRPTESQNLGATFEIDALATFFPNAEVYVNLRVQVRGDPFSAPMYDLDFNDRPFTPGSLQTWSMKRTINVPLKALGKFAETVTFDIMSSDGGYVYGVGGMYGMQHQLIVKRIQ